MPKDFGEAVRTVRRIIAGDTNTYGLLVWFGGNMEESGFRSPTTTTIHRWIRGKNNPSEDALATLSDLEEKAKKILKGDLDLLK